jgi:hypothetical protein
MLAKISVTQHNCCNSLLIPQFRISPTNHDAVLVQIKWWFGTKLILFYDSTIFILNFLCQEERVCRFAKEAFMGQTWELHALLLTHAIRQKSVSWLHLPTGKAGGNGPTDSASVCWLMNSVTQLTQISLHSKWSKMWLATIVRNRIISSTLMCSCIFSVCWVILFIFSQFF